MIECLEISRLHPRPDLVHQLTRELERGRLVACPTDTTYGVFAVHNHSQAVERLRKLRSRMAGSSAAAAKTADKPLAMIFSDLAMLGEYVVLSGPAFKLVKRLLPGPYTIILPASRAVPKQLQTKRRHLGVRIPDDPLAQAIVQAHGLPILSTTLKAPDGELLADPITISDCWPNHLDYVIDSGPFVPEVSTVLSVEDGAVHLLREGKGPVDLL